MALDVWFPTDIAHILHSLDMSNERHRTPENQDVIDAYRNALIDVGLAFGIQPKENSWLVDCKRAFG